MFRLGGVLPRNTRNTMFQYNNLRRFSTKLYHYTNEFSIYNGRTGGKIVYDKLIENDVKHAFLYSGGAIMPVIDAFYKGEIKYFVNTHEQNGGHAATGYAKSSGNPGVCIVTSGPGLTNLITPMLDAQNDSTPLVVFSGQVPLKAMGTNAFQECPATELTKSFTKWSYCVQSTEELPEAIDWAFHLANNGKKGVVHLDLPKCVSASVFNFANFQPKKFEYLREKLVKRERKRKSINLGQIEQICSVINKSENPVLYLGQGANHCKDIVTKIAEHANIPVTTTIHGMGIIDEDHRMSLNFLGMHGHAAANYAIQDSDCIICVGARFDDRTTGNLEKYAPKAIEAAKEGRGGIIHCNIEKSEIDKVVKADHSIQADSEHFLNAAFKFLEKKDRIDWINKIQNWKNKHPFKYDMAPNSKIKTQDVILSINKNLKKINKEYVISTGVGNHQMMTCQYINWTRPNSMVTSGSLGVMGSGLPYAVGAQIANPDMLVIDIDGDSSFNHTMSDLKTVIEHNLPIKIAIMNDGHQSMVRVWEELFYDGRIAATTLERNPDYCALANSFGITSVSCDNIDDLDTTVDLFLNHDGPILCDFRVVTDHCYPLVAPGKGLDEMILHDDKTNTDFDKSLPPS